MLNQIREKLHVRSPVARLPGDARVREAAVLMAFTERTEPDVVFIKRAEHVNSHSGQVAFPGGMWEAEDSNLIETALRETEEEIGLPRDKVEIIAALDPRETRFEVMVSPYVGIIPPGMKFVPEEAELDAVFEVPLSFLLQDANYSRARFDTPVGSYEAPCIHYGRFMIWGFTYRLLVETLEEVFGFSPRGDQETLELDGGY